MASFLLPSSIQKRLLRYALSRLELLDTDALDLEHLEISWGTKTILEFRDVGIRLKRLAHALQLPPTFDLTKTRVLLLRLTIPVDIYSSPIVVEVDGVEGHLKTIPVFEHGVSKPKTPTNHDRSRQRRDRIGLKSFKNEAGSAETQGTTFSDDKGQEDEEETLLTAADLAASFLQTEPLEERAELEAAISSQSQILGASVALSDDGDDESATGTGATLSLPWFMANFLNGIVDRLQVRVRDITLNIEADVPNENTSRPETNSGMDTVTLQIHVDDVDIEGITFGTSDPPTKISIHETTKLAAKDGKRLVALRNLRGSLISDASLFAQLARSSGLSSPSVTYSDLMDTAKGHTDPNPTPPSPVIGMTDEPSQQSSLSISKPSPETESILLAARRTQDGLSSAIVTSDSGRFDDAPEDDEEDDVPGDYAVDSVSDNGRYNLDESAYKNQMTDSRSNEAVATDDYEYDLPFVFPNRRRYLFPEIRSPLSTPTASVYLSQSEDQHQHTTAHGRSTPNSGGARLQLQSSLLPDSPQRSFARDRASQSQPKESSEGPPTSPKMGQYAEDLPLIRGSTSDSSDEYDDTGNGSTPVGEDDLAQSRIFSHEDAESMYMSALSQGSISARIPGTWDASSGASTKPTETKSPDFPPSPKATQTTQHSSSDDDLMSHISEDEPILSPAHSPSTISMSSLVGDASARSSPKPQSGNATPVPVKHEAASSTSGQSDTSSNESAMVTKQIFCLNQVGIYLPASAKRTTSADILQPDQSIVLPGSKYGGYNVISESTSPKIPGAFSVPSAAARSRVLNADPQDSPNSRTKVKVDKPQEIEVSMGHFEVQIDVSVCRLLARLFQRVSETWPVTKQKSETPEDHRVSPLMLHLTVDRISIKLLERLTGLAATSSHKLEKDKWIKAPSSDVLLRTTLKGLDVKLDTNEASTEAALTLQKFIFGYARENIVSFDSDLRMRASVRDLADTAGLDLAINFSSKAGLSRCKVSTLPIHVSIDLQRLDETFMWFGGLSSVLNMGSSAASNVTVTATNPGKSIKKSRGVRFETPIKPEDKSIASQNKAEARIGGFILDLVGKECNVRLNTTAVKIISRDEGIGIGIDKIKISGPHIKRSHENPAILAELTGMLINYLPSPQDEDLDRLLALITPSKAKYDRDDDILLDTLLRQRRQGAVLRLNLESCKATITKLEQLNLLPQLGEEVERLSTVAKYLPEDDRPGLLSLVRVRKLGFTVEVNETLGSFSLTASDIELAQITLPALVALSVSSITVHRNGQEELLGAATNVEQRESKSRAPAIMARMIGDEMEPVVKVKLWNLRLEYRVPMVMALLGLSGTATAEDMAKSLAISVATLTERRPSQLSFDTHREDGKRSPLKNPESKAMMIDIILRDCIFGLNPLGLPSKVLMVMTEVHVSAILPKDNHASATAEMSKGSLLVVDDVANIVPASSSARIRRESFDGGSDQVAHLCSMGFVSVSYISSAKAVVRVFSVDDLAEKSIDVEIRDDLLVLETCADSMKTLVAALSGLAPPTPPTKETRYRTRVIPVQDLLASLSGDAFGTAEGNYDFDEDFGTGFAGVAGDLAEDEDVAGLEFDSQYYHDGNSPIKSSNHSSTGPESREGSLLFDQFTTTDTKDGVLLESFTEKEQVHLHEELNFQEDHFGSGSILEGTAHRWNSAKNTYDRSNERNVRRSPLKVCVRDVHIIWNLFDGYDWQYTRYAIAKAVKDLESKAIEKRARNDRRPTFEQDIDDEESVIGDFLFNSIYIGVHANRDISDLAVAINRELNDNATETESVAATTVTATPSRQASATKRKEKRLRLKRSKHHKITFELKGVNVDLVTFPPGSGETQSSIDLRVHDFDIFDHVPSSTWRKFATYMKDAGERESGTSQVHIEVLNVKPLPELAASEIVLKATVLPLRLHVDQDALDFITRFFEFKDDSSPADAPAGDAPFLQRVEVNAVQVKLDFKPKRVDYAGLRSGHTTEFMNFIVLDEADMVLRHTIIYGISGFDKLGKCLNDIWMPDIKRNQLPGILAGLAPVRSIVNVGGGMRDLVMVPVREYKKDGRVVRSISKGAAAFARTTGTELIKLGTKLAIGTQTVLQGAEVFLNKPQDRDSGWDDDDLDEEEKKQISLYADQPIGVVQGLKGAYASLERDLLMARDAIIAIPGEVMESTTAQGAAKAIMVRAPTVILRPAIGVSKAISQTLMGATNSLDPQNRRRVEDKYKKH